MRVEWYFMHCAYIQHSAVRPATERLEERSFGEMIKGPGCGIAIPS